MFHAGAEGADKTRVPGGREHAFGEDRGDSRHFARAAIDAGADLVVGSGPHVVRGLELYRGRLIAYSLGNLTGYRNFSTAGTSGLSGLLRVTLDADGTAPRSRSARCGSTGSGSRTPTAPLDRAADAAALAGSTSAAAIRSACSSGRSRPCRWPPSPAARLSRRMTRLSQYLLPTEKQPPADAEALSHKLLVRAGMIRQLGAGLWTWMPAGWRVHENVVQIIREEMNAIGGQEMLMPVLHPAELWQRSGRYAIPELLKLQDRRGAELVLAMTHEENITFHMASIVRSYRDLPQILYHFQTKERDEPRPRAACCGRASSS